MLLRIAILLCLAAGSRAQQNHCSKEHLDRCLLAVTLEARDDASLSTVDTMRHCRDVRRNMNCIIWYTRNCLAQSMRRSTSDVIQNARSYLKSFCEYFDRVDENWMGKSCFLNSEMEDCKDAFLKLLNGLPQRGEDQQACSRFSLFRRCADRVFNSRCSEDDVLYLPTYLLDKAGQLSWICADETSYFVPVDEKGIRRSLKGAACLSRNQAGLSRCRSSYEKEREAGTRDPLAAACCAFEEYRYCVLNLLPSRCDSESRELAENGLDKMTAELGGMCGSYGFRSDQCSSGHVTLPKYNIVVLAALIIASRCIPWVYDCWR